jgi:tetratricopeptide (TPR) repeat protein
MFLKSNLKPILIIITVVVWASIFGIQSCQNESKEDLTFSADSPPALYAHENFVGSESCKSCHESEYADWYTSHHAQAMAEANDSTVVGDFNNTTFSSKGFTSKFYKEGDKYFVNTVGPEGEMDDFEVVYTFGITPLQQYLVRFPDGKFQTLHLTWDSEKNEWFEQYENDTFPSWDWLHWTKGAMTWNSMCADCHSTNLEKNYTTETDSYQTTWSIINVSCEACHGPGKKHVDYINSSAYDSTNAVKASFLKLTDDIAPIEQIEQCAPCHSRRSQVTAKYDMSGRYLDHFIHEVLREELYYADGQIKEEDYVYGSFLQSKMFQNGVKCSNCHNVHSGNLLLAGNALCGQCHFKDQYDTPEHHFHPVATESAECVNCHMTGEVYMGNDFRRDHSFRIPRPDYSIDYDIPNACNQCHTDKSATWAAYAIKEWYGPDRKPNYTDMLVKGREDPQELIQLANDKTQPAIARATAVDALRSTASEDAYQTTVKALSDPDARVKIVAINALANLSLNDRIRLLSPLLKNPVRAVRVATANVLADASKTSLPLAYQEAYDLASKENEEAIQQNADFSMGQFRIGQYREMKGEDSLAMTAYLRSIKIDSLNTSSRINLSRIYNSLNRNDLAIRTLSDLTIMEPESIDGYYYLGLVHAEEKNIDEAVLAFGKAIELEPRNPRYYYNLGLMLQQNGRPDEAEKILNQALQIIPEADDVRYALATSYAENGKMDLALEQTMILAEKYPQNQNIQQLLNMLQRPGSD